MSAEHPERLIVCCDGCGTPYPAVADGGDTAVVGESEAGCPACGSDSFSRITI